MSARKTCGATGCRKTFIPKSRQKFCSVKCQRSTAYKRNKKETIEIEEPVIKSTSRGPEYKNFVENYAAKLEDNRLTHQQVAYALKVSRSVVTKMYAAYLEDKKNYEAQSDWKIAQATVK